MLLATLKNKETEEIFVTLLEEKDLHKIYLLDLEVIEMEKLYNFIPFSDIDFKENDNFDLEFGIN